MSKAPDVILLVDDDAAVRNALKFSLEMEGFSVRLYPTPEALLAETDLPADGCLVIDYRMPEIDGLELVERLRNRGVALPVLLISGRVTRSLRDRASGLGIRDVLEKPLSDLVGSIRRVLDDGP
ncbi:response regulator transcription factor [Reyranella sp.]|jgi:two-component system response regulator FixJ|uniref:response regulator transcription factor n=1 Tax=Reyranella sp. TaxID=1929291 RepID=UPI002719B2A3|nr:response regulator [Reyranella sp.]MDO8972751.1 response regulator [Reyranella sp.]